VTNEILSEDAIDVIVRKLPTSQKRINARRRLRKATNQAINVQIEIQRCEIRKQKAHGIKNCALREAYADISHLEYQYLYSRTGNKY